MHSRDLPQTARAAPHASRALLVAAIALSPFSSAAAQGAANGGGGVLIRDVRLFDGERVVPRASVLVRDGRIARVAPTIQAPTGVHVVDGAGKTLIPGLIDAHTHTWGNALRDAAVLGVTTMLDMFTEPKSASDMRRLDGTPAGRNVADFRSAGVLVTAPKGHGTEYGIPIPTITSPGEAQAFVDARLGEGSDYIKIVYDDGRAYGLRVATIDKPTMKAVIDATHARNKLAVVHIGDYASARDAIESGTDGLVHLFVDRAPEPSFAKMVADRRAFVIPTLTVLESIAGRKGGEALATDARVAPYVGPDNVTNLKTTFPGRPGSVRDFQAALTTVRQLRDAGVPILAGSDAPNPGTTHGASIHRELELLVEAGLTPVEALRAATSVPARAFSLADRGRIAPGLRADLVLVNGDPTTDILATRDIVAIWKRGLTIDRDGYRADVAKAAAAVASGAFPVPPGSESGDVSDFDAGQPTAKFGAGWFVTTDQLAGGKSVAAIKVVSGGANNTPGALEIAGTLDAGLPFGWSGVMFTPGQAPMSPVNLSSKKELRFFARAEQGSSFVLMMFTRGKGRMPAMLPFKASAEWAEVVLPFSSFDGIDARDLTGIAFVASGSPGAFRLLIDDVRLR
ncbi:MAG TPA: amidohydrolase family protein [Gemmatimonadaceae bacterium]|nr:amidohydrolase family protein [Gemmatimonadaceae bacterium]